MARSVVVVGGGISGLAAAWHLVTGPQGGEPLEVTVLESSAQVGGKLRLAPVGGAVVDVGAESVLARRPEALTLMDELGLSRDVTHPAAVSASIVSGGRRWPMPRGTLMGVPSDPESVRGLLTDLEVDRLMAEADPIRHPGDVAIGQLVDERLGAAVTDKLVEPLLAGVYAGHARSISLEVALPALLRAAREGTSVLDVARAAADTAAGVATTDGARPVFAGLVGGLGTLPLLLADELRRRGVTVRVGTTVRALRAEGSGFVVTSGPTTAEVDERYDAVVVATPAAPTARLLAPMAPAASTGLAGIDYASMAIVTVAFDGSVRESLDGSGFLVPPTEPLTIKAATFSSVKWPWLATAHPDLTLLRASVGRHREVAVLQRSDSELVDVALADLATVLGRPLPTPTDTHVQRWGGGLPQYAVGHRARVDAARSAASAAGVALCGAAYDGVGIPACIASGRAAAREVLTRLGAA